MSNSTDRIWPKLFAVSVFGMLLALTDVRQFGLGKTTASIAQAMIILVLMGIIYIVGAKVGQLTTDKTSAPKSISD